MPTKLKNLVPCIAIAACLILSACGSAAEVVNETKRIWVQPDRVECQGEAPQMCLRVAESPDGDFRNFFDQIEGFEFVEGTSYILDVTVEDVDDPPADGSSLRYILVEVVEESP